MNDIPSYEDLKQIKSYKTYDIFFPIIGGYFRLTINEDGVNNIALDYIEGGYLQYINYNFNSNYHFSKLYKFNKKNYEGLIKLYKKMLKVMYEDIEKELKNNT